MIANMHAVRFANNVRAGVQDMEQYYISCFELNNSSITFEYEDTHNPALRSPIATHNQSCIWEPYTYGIIHTKLLTYKQVF